MIWLLLFVLAGVALEGVIHERRSRRWQRAECARLVQQIDNELRKYGGAYAIESVTFRAGFRTGRGEARWSSPSGYTVSFTIDVAAPRFDALGQVIA